MVISKATITVPSLYWINWSDNVTLAGGCTTNGLGKVVFGIVATSCWVPKV